MAHCTRDTTGPRDVMRGRGVYGWYEHGYGGGGVGYIYPYIPYIPYTRHIYHNGL